ncbi:MAG: NAD(P)H-binding protein [Phycisphaerales bacterium]
MNQPARQTVSVTGATGFVGRHTVRALLDAGHTVRALVRSHEKARILPNDERLTRVEGDLFDAGSLDRLCEGTHAMVHCVGIRREYPTRGITFERLHVRGVERVVDAAERAGLERYVHVSALGTAPDQTDGYTRSKWAGEQIVRSSGLDWTILRPSIIHGPDGEFMQMVKAWVLGRSSPRFFLPYFVRPEGLEGFPPRPKFVSAQVQPVAVEDVASAAVRAIASDDAVGEIYPLVGPETVDWPTLLRTVRDAMPVTSKKPCVPLPAPLGVAMAHGARFLGLADLLPFGPSEPAMAARDNTANAAKAHAHLGLEPVSFTDSVKAYAGAI